MIRFDSQHITHVIREPVHNGFLLVAAETGLPALGFPAGADLGPRPGLGGAAQARLPELHFAAGLSGLAVFGGFAAANLFDVTLRKESVAGLIVVAAAMVAALKRMDAPPRPDAASG